MKKKIERFARSGTKFQTTAFICAGWYLQSFLSKEVAPEFGGFPHVVDPQGYLTFKVPRWGGQEDVPWLSVTDDFGDIVRGIFLAPDKWTGQIIHGVKSNSLFQ